MQKIHDCNTLTRRNDETNLNGEEIFKIKLALSSLANSVMLCPMVANVYTKPTTDDETWTYFKRGVPAIVLHHDIDRIVTSVQFCLADPNSGFAIWRETLSELSDYKATQNNFHTFKMTSNKNCMAGVKFPLDEGPHVFLRDVVESIPKPCAGLDFTKVSISSPLLRRLREGDSSIRKKISKEEISTPCMFTHVTSATMIKRKGTSKENSRSSKDRHSSKLNKNPGAASPLCRKQNVTKVCY